MTDTRYHYGMGFPGEHNDAFLDEYTLLSDGAIRSGFFPFESIETFCTPAELIDPVAASSPALEALHILEENGGEAWFVGGWVRDIVLRRKSYDLDIATSLHPKSVTDAFNHAGWQVIPTGIKHGTVTVHAPQMLLGDACCAEGIKNSINPTSFEITTYRSDGNYHDARHPDSVRFVESIEDDLSRRDFTCNAIAYHPQRGLKDPFGGIQDIHDGKLKAVGEPAARFQEDALRILRGLRFCSQLGFSLEENTAQAMVDHRKLIDSLSAERVAHELTLLLCGNYVADAMLAYPEIICEAIPELEPCVGFNQLTKYHCYDVYEHIVRTVSYTPATPLDRWVALLHDIGKPETFFIGKDGSGHFYGHGQKSDTMAHDILKRLKMPSQFIDDVCLLVHYHDSIIQLETKAVKRVLRRFGDKVPNLLNIKLADSLAHAPEYRDRADAIPHIQKAINDIQAEGEAYTLKQLAISGNDLLDKGYHAGPIIGAMLEACLDDVISGQIANEKSALLAHACSLAPSLYIELEAGNGKSKKERVNSRGVPIL